MRLAEDLINRIYTADLVFLSLDYMLSRSTLRQRREGKGYSFAEGGSTLTLPCSHVARMAPSLARFITPSMVQRRFPAWMTVLSIRTSVPEGIGRTPRC